MYINVHVCTCVILIIISFLQNGNETTSSSSSSPELRLVRRIPAKWSLIEAQNRAALYIEPRKLGVRQETSLMFDEPQVYILLLLFKLIITLYILCYKLLTF